jgi:hypothetical protein
MAIITIDICDLKLVGALSTQLPVRYMTNGAYENIICHRKSAIWRIDPTADPQTPTIMASRKRRYSGGGGSGGAGNGGVPVLIAMVDRLNAKFLIQCL